MRQPIHLAASFLLATTLAHAQIHSPQVTIKKKTKPENIEWLWQFSPSDKLPEGDENALVRDPRFEPLLKRNFLAPQAFFGRQQEPRTTLADTAETFLAVPGEVLADGNRYLTITGCVRGFCHNRGLLWADLNAPRNQDPLLLFAAIDWTTENRPPDDPAATYTLWLFPNQPLDPAPEASNRIPPPFLAALRRWVAPQHITTTILVDPDGTPHPLDQNLLNTLEMQDHP